MGTSKSFSEIGHSKIPNWGDLSGSMTRNCNGGSLTTSSQNAILRNYIDAIGSAKKAGRGNSKIGGSSSIKTAKKIMGFLNSFSGSGNSLKETLKQIGIADIESKNVSDIIEHLIEYTSSSANTIDDKAAKEASRLLFEDLIKDANDIDEVEKMLSQKLNENTVEELVVNYFGYYIYSHLSCWFYEHLIKSKNEADCENLFRQIKNSIFVIGHV